jgi:hypothetical protein
MALAAEILARSQEKMTGPLPQLENRLLVERFLELEKKLSLLSTLRGLNEADEAVAERRNIILILSDASELEIQTFRDAPDALRALFRLEKEHPERDIVLVKADTTAEVRLAFKNYFSDARDFIKLVESGCAELSSGARTATFL